jgi:NAD(P)-dependent dehydrogenase (short-subunit alcohol dehydrogenase family)
MMPNPKAITKQSYDLQFGTNVLGHYYLTTLLVEPLKAAAASPGAQPSRVVNVSSAGHLFTKGINWDTLKDGEPRQKADLFELYNQSKFVSHCPPSSSG